MPASLTTVARRYTFVRETEGPNAGYFVNLFQRFAGGVEGDSWCSDFESYVENIAYKGKEPGKRTGSCEEKLAHAKAHGWVVTSPQPDDLFFYVTDTGHPHHVGIVTAVAPLTGIAGNTSEDGASANGDGVWEHTLVAQPKHIVFVRLPR